MSEPGDPDSAPAVGVTSPADQAEEFECLRRLLLGTDRDRLSELERRLGDPDVQAEELSRILPASLLRASRRDNRLTISLSPILDEALADSVKKNRRRLADALAPAMGPAIRRAIAETLRTMVDSFNQVLQYSFSPRALRWRIESWQTGRPFAEVVLSHSLVFRVEQVFLVHRETGLLLEHVAADPASAQDVDLVSGMLTAIQDFVRDSFSVDSEQAVDTMRVGDLGVWVEQGEKAYVAAEVRGTPPIGLRRVLRDALETIHLELAEAFERFSGDASPFEEARHHLEGCLQMQVAGRRARRFWLAPTIVGGVVLALLGVWLALSLVAGQRWNAYLTRLAREPGILVVAEDGGIRRSSISGLADPHAADPVRLLGDYGLGAARVSSKWEPYVSQAAPIVLARARATLKPPPSVTLTLSDMTLVASGSAPHSWVVTSSNRAMTIPGVVGFDAGRLEDSGLAAIDPVRRRLEGAVLRFDVGAAELPRREQETLDRVVAALRELADLARDAGMSVRVEVIGHTDATGSEATNVRLSRARAEWLVSAAESRGVRGLTFVILGAGASRSLRTEQTEADRAFNRSVTFSVGIQH